MPDTTTREDRVLTEIREAMKGQVRLAIVYTFTHGDAVQVEAHKPHGSERSGWRKVGPLLFPPTGGTLADTLSMLAGFRDEAAS